MGTLKVRCQLPRRLSHGSAAESADPRGTMPHGASDVCQWKPMDKTAPIKTRKSTYERQPRTVLQQHYVGEQTSHNVWEAIHL